VYAACAIFERDCGGVESRRGTAENRDRLTAQRREIDRIGGMRISRGGSPSLSTGGT